jgi:hypothetical protein
MQPSSPSRLALMARWRSWVAAKVQTPGGYHFTDAGKMLPRGEAQGYHFNDVVKMLPTGKPQGGQAGQAAGGQVIRFPVERRR